MDISIKISIDGQNVDIKKAREIYTKLKDIFEPNAPVMVPFTPRFDYPPTAPYGRDYVTTCGGTT